MPIDICRFGIEALLGSVVVEMYHKPLTTIFKKLTILMASYNSDTSILSMCLKMMNDTPGPEAKVSSGLFFGAFPTANVVEELKEQN